jgi:hypothetical protein
MRLIFRIGTSLVIAALLVIVILNYAESINSFLQNSIAAQILLLVLILVDAIGVVLTPWIESWIADARKRNERLTEECIAKLELDPSADDEHVLTIPSKQSEGYPNIFASAKIGDRPPYYQEMKECLQNYPDLWKLIQDLPILYRNAKRDRESLDDDVKRELENTAMTENLTFPRETKDSVIHKLTETVVSDIMNNSARTDYPLEGRDGDSVLLGSWVLAIPSSEAMILATRMTELNSLYKEKGEKIKNDFGRVQKGKDDFVKERDKIVEQARLSNYKNLKRTPWWK